MTTSITVEAAVLGRRRAGIREHPLELDAATINTLRDLITVVVSNEVAGYERRREERSLVAVLTQATLDDGTDRGVVRHGDQEVPAAPPVDEAVATAMLAFEDGQYQIWLDDRAVESLDDRIELVDGSRLMFLRLVALAGG